MRATRAVIHLDNFLNNLETIRKRTGPRTEICFSLKAGAYGHGAIQMARYALQAGVNCFGIAAVSEGRQLRRAGIREKIFIFSQTLPEEIRGITEAALTPFVSDSETIKALAAAAGSDRPLEVHLKVDTGMGRLGCRPEEAKELAALIAQSKSLKLGGMATHLSVSDSADAGDIAYTKKQIAVFRETAETVRKAGIDPGKLHAANSGAICNHDDSYFDMVRPGILLYGYFPSEHRPDGMNIKPVMEFRSAVVLIKKIRAGEEVSYGRTWKAAEDTYIGNIPAGYADGFPRLLSGNYSVQIRGKSYPLAGRICMDQCMINLGGGGDVRRWDEAVIFGPGFTDAADIAKKTGTIPYEILCNINKRVPRIYVNQGK